VEGLNLLWRCKGLVPELQASQVEGFRGLEDGLEERERGARGRKVEMDGKGLRGRRFESFFSPGPV